MFNPNNSKIGDKVFVEEGKENCDKIIGVSMHIIAKFT